MKFIHGVTNYEEWRNHDKDNKKYLERMEIIKDLLHKKDSLTFSEEVLLASLIVVSALTGKLEDFYSISTSVLMNPICQARANFKDCICAFCYAAAGVARFSGLCQGLETNYIILNNFKLSEDALATVKIPSMNDAARIESHGDSATEICATNHSRLVASHKQLTFGVWSKNLAFYKNVFDREGKPNNMIFIASSPIINKPIEISEEMKWYVDHVFTVYEKEYAKQHGIKINCGKWVKAETLDHRCKLCMKCYNNGNKDYYINELLK